MSVLLIIVMVTIAGCAATNQAQHHAESQPQEVLGTMVIRINPTDLASLPEPPIDLMLHIRQMTGGHDVIYDIADGMAIWELFTEGPNDVGVCFQNFRLVLPPGNYFVAGLDVRAKSLSDKPFFLPTGGPSFTVPKGGCVYIGRINATYLRLPPGSLDQAKATTGKISAATGNPLRMIYLTKGALLATALFVDQPTEDECTPAGDYCKQLLAYAHHNVCTVQCVAALTGCASAHDKGQVYHLLPPNAESEYLKTVNVGILLEGSVTPTEISYSITLKVQKPLPKSAIAVLKFENPDPRADPVEVVYEPKPDQKEIFVISPSVACIVNGRYYRVVVTLFGDRERRDILGTHEQMVAFFVSSKILRMLSVPECRPTE
ncbi:hypothetical protein DO021_15525 [Desulfobacter hydrogenophilus]|nr:hypothetical protein DO021_15525 [Desulfobacter hydrogenophilus]